MIPNFSGGLAKCVFRIVWRIRGAVEASIVTGVQQRIYLLRKGHSDGRVELCCQKFNYRFNERSNPTPELQSSRDLIAVSLFAGTYCRDSL